MNIPILTQGPESLDAAIRTWFSQHPDALPPEDKELKISMETGSRSYLMVVQSSPANSLEETLKLPVGIIEPHISERCRVRILNALSHQGITTIGELCQKNRLDILRIRNLSNRSLKEIQDGLKAIDSHLCLGMKAPTE